MKRKKRIVLACGSSSEGGVGGVGGEGVSESRTSNTHIFIAYRSLYSTLHVTQKAVCTVLYNRVKEVIEGMRLMLGESAEWIKDK